MKTRAFLPLSLVGTLPTGSIDDLLPLSTHQGQSLQANDKDHDPVPKGSREAEHKEGHGSQTQTQTQLDDDLGRFRAGVAFQTEQLDGSAGQTQGQPGPHRKSVRGWDQKGKRHHHQGQWVGDEAAQAEIV